MAYDEGLAQRVREILDEQGGLIEKKMFGGIGFMLQGLAVVHSLRSRSGVHQVWLVVLYVLLFIAMVHTALALAAVGLADVWLDFRARFRAGSKSGPDPD